MVKINTVASVEEALALIRAGKDTVLDVHSHAEIGDKGATDIAMELRSQNNIEIVMLGGQKIGPAGAAAIGEGLRKNTKIKELHLHNNNLGYEGVKKLCQELVTPWTKGGSKPGNKTLKHLSLRNNNIGPHCGDCGLCRFSPQFPSDLLDLTSLQVIDLHGNQIAELPLAMCQMPALVRKNPLENIPEDVFFTAREGHLTGWPILKEYLLQQYEKEGGGRDRDY